MCIVAGLAILFIGGAVWNLFHGDFDNAAFGLVIGAILGAIAFVLGREENETEKFLGFLVENREALQSGATPAYGDIPISLNTEVTQFYSCLSFVILTTKIPSRFYLRGHHKTGGIGTIYSVISLIAGWWGFPWGPIYTIQSLYKNMRGGDKSTVAQLLAKIKTVEPADKPADNSTAPAPIADPTPRRATGTAPPASPWSS